MTSQAAGSAASLPSHIFSVHTAAAEITAMEVGIAVLNMPGVSHGLQDLMDALYLYRWMDR